ncbi:SIR2 family protein, partial [Acinetobacter baumannii]|nr:SIR2 family protein [Acinetobacter baumannii]
MIGAGFSLNAIPTSASAKKFPLWSQVAKNLCSRLYPPSEKIRLEQALTEASGTSGFLRLAQEYEIAFGRGSLHNFIQDSVPDLEYQPSELHYQLLELPWKEVLTTNWDTLLERAQFEIPERNYSIVRTVEELASTPSPRIIKLHGTVPSHIPFIFTEEDYRTYPRKFAPFVNTVQQIMMESTVLLIGFSGDDPNFLQWSGWVRDNLGETAPKIYLAGWLGLSPHRRRMLENNNVVAIDIANHPKANEWPEHLRHHYATEWIIKTLQCG